MKTGLTSQGKSYTFVYAPRRNWGNPRHCVRPRGNSRRWSIHDRLHEPLAYMYQNIYNGIEQIGCHTASRRCNRSDSCFGIPVPVLGDSTSSIAADTEKAATLRTRTSMIMWDEGQMMPDCCFHVHAFRLLGASQVLSLAINERSSTGCQHKPLDHVFGSC